MKNDKLIEFKKMTVLKALTKGKEKEKEKNSENESNAKELTLKSVELYEPITFEQLLQLNKIKYRNEKIKLLKIKFTSALWTLSNIISLYKELINRTEFWEKKSTYEFNFEDWNTLKKANGKLTRYYNDIIKIQQKIEREEL